ncbi:MarR family transcriptional regulator [Nocardioides sp.]|uniref:MarR family winged helix-turn-helix transcriptional regulator n=1 Tax=Nocardioides sp. TaxID=35761 RepID=UPI0025ED1682|nr:MarR family transcriptional regulator [Nocardioides sp.]
MSTSQAPALEVATLRLVNAIALTAGTRSHSRRLRAVTGIDLPPSDLRFLELLSGREPAATTVIARELGIDITQASRQAAQLHKAGHLARTTDPDDRRRTLLSLTDETTALMDAWLMAWSRDYLAVISTWTPEQIEVLGSWFALVLHRFSEALPDSPRPAVADRWLELAGEEYDPATRFFLHTMIGIVTWVALSGGFKTLLELRSAGVSEAGFLALHVIATSGPLSIAEVAGRLAVDPSQASKRITELVNDGFLDRAVDEFDRRSTRVRVSRKGKQLVDGVFEFQMAGFGVLTTDLGRAERDQWTPYVEAYVDGMLNRRVGSDGLIRPQEVELSKR